MALRYSLLILLLLCTGVLAAQPDINVRWRPGNVCG